MFTDGSIAKERVSIIEEKCNIPFENLFPNQLNITEIKTNKGSVEQMLEKAIGKPLNNKKLDFVDGELKTYKCDKNGNPKETICISQLSSKTFDVLLDNFEFQETYFYEKIVNTLYVPVVKINSLINWHFKNPIHINLNNEKYRHIVSILENDFAYICQQANELISNGENIHTISGRYLQIRSKDSKPYKPIYSEKYNRKVSNKNYALYFKKDFIKEVVLHELDII